MRENEDLFMKFEKTYGKEITWAVFFIMPFYDDPRFKIEIKDKAIYNAFVEYRKLMNLEIKRNEWIKDDISGIIKCNNCGADAPISTISGQQYESKYCPYCGEKIER